MTLLQLKVALTGLKFEAKTGMKMTNKVNTYRWVATALGYPVKARPKVTVLIAELEALIGEYERLRKLQEA